MPDNNRLSTALLGASAGMNDFAEMALKVQNIKLQKEELLEKKNYYNLLKQNHFQGTGESMLQTVMKSTGKTRRMLAKKLTPEINKAFASAGLGADLIDPDIIALDETNEAFLKVQAAIGKGAQLASEFRKKGLSFEESYRQARENILSDPDTSQAFSVVFPGKPDAVDDMMKGVFGRMEAFQTYQRSEAARGQTIRDFGKTPEYLGILKGLGATPVELPQQAGGMFRLPSDTAPAKGQMNLGTGQVGQLAEKFRQPPTATAPQAVAESGPKYGMMFSKPGRMDTKEFLESGLRPLPEGTTQEEAASVGAFPIAVKRPDGVEQTVYAMPKESKTMSPQEQAGLLMNAKIGLDMLREAYATLDKDAGVSGMLTGPLGGRLAGALIGIGIEPGKIADVDSTTGLFVEAYLKAVQGARPSDFDMQYILGHIAPSLKMTKGARRARLQALDKFMEVALKTKSPKEAFAKMGLGKDYEEFAKENKALLETSGKEGSLSGPVLSKNVMSLMDELGEK